MKNKKIKIKSYRQPKDFNKCMFISLGKLIEKDSWHEKYLLDDVEYLLIYNDMMGGSQSFADLWINKVDEKTHLDNQKIKIFPTTKEGVKQLIREQEKLQKNYKLPTEKELLDYLNIIFKDEVD